MDDTDDSADTDDKFERPGTRNSSAESFAIE
jgi:hypothetical protein